MVGGLAAHVAPLRLHPSVRVALCPDFAQRLSLVHKLLAGQGVKAAALQVLLDGRALINLRSSERASCVAPRLRCAAAQLLRRRLTWPAAVSTGSRKTFCVIGQTRSDGTSSNSPSSALRPFLECAELV